MSFTVLNLATALILATLAAVLVILPYLWGRSRRRVLVPSLKLWSQLCPGRPVQQRWRVTELWSLLLQLLATTLLVLASAGILLKPGGRTPRDHVVVIDTSAWMASRPEKTPLLEVARQLAWRYVSSLPPQDRVLVVEAAAIPIALTSFEGDRQVVQLALRGLRVRPSAFALRPALEFAQQALERHSRSPGEIVVITPGYIRDDAKPEHLPPAVRWIPVQPRPWRNVGITRLAARRVGGTTEGWQILVALRNYSPAPTSVDLFARFAEAPAGQARLRIPGGQVVEHQLLLRTNAAGLLEIQLDVRDDLAADNQARLQLPAWRPLEVAIVTDRREVFRAMFDEHPLVRARYETARPSTNAARADVVILDGGPTPHPSSQPTLVISNRATGPAETRPERIQVVTNGFPQLLAVRGAELIARPGNHLQVKPQDLPIARTTAGVVGVFRPASRNGSAQVVLGFDPLAPEVRAQLAVPLLLTGLIELLANVPPQQWELVALSPGPVSVSIPTGLQPKEIRLVDANGQPVPFRLADRALEFYVDRPTVVRLQWGHREWSYSLTLPDISSELWSPPRGVPRGIPRVQPPGSREYPLWPWLAGLAAGLWLWEWHRYASRSSERSPTRGSAKGWARPAALVRLNDTSSSNRRHA